MREKLDRPLKSKAHIKRPMREEPTMEGRPAPDFALPDQDGEIVRLSKFRGKKIILFFYVRDDTPGCTKEACGFRDDMGLLKRRNVVVLGVSPDEVSSHKHFAEKYGLPFPLLSDPKAVVAKRYGVWGKKNMYGRTYFGIIRTTFLIDESGRIAREYRRVKVDGHLAQVLSELK